MPRFAIYDTVDTDDLEFEEMLVRTKEGVTRPNGRKIVNVPVQKLLDIIGDDEYPNIYRNKEHPGLIFVDF